MSRRDPVLGRREWSRYGASVSSLSSVEVSVHAAAVAVPQPGVVVVRYAAAADLAPEKQGEVVDLIRAEAASGPVGIVFVIADGVRLVPPSVPMYWLGVTSDDSHQLRAIAVVSASVAVRTAASAFGVTNALRGNGLEVKPERSLEPALSWVQARISTARAARA